MDIDRCRNRFEVAKKAADRARRRNVEAKSAFQASIREWTSLDIGGDPTAEMSHLAHRAMREYNEAGVARHRLGNAALEESRALESLVNAEKNMLANA